MIREFSREEVVDTFVEVVREKSPIFLVDQTASVELNLILHSIIRETIEKVIKKASPNLRVVVSVNSIHNEMYGHNNKFEPFFGTDPSDVHFYVTREAVPASYYFPSLGRNEDLILTCTNIGIDYYYPAPWAITPPRNEQESIRRTMDEILFAWTIVSKTLLSAPIVRFDDEEEAAEAIFTFANTLLFNEVVAGKYHYKHDFLMRLKNIQGAILGNQIARGKDLATIILPKDNKIGSLDVPVVTIKDNKVSQFIDGYIACYGQERNWEYLTVLKTFNLHGLGAGLRKFSEQDIQNYLSNNVGQPTDDYINCNMRRIQRLLTNGACRSARPPMVDMAFKGVVFINVCPFTYGTRNLAYIHFEKDIISHLEKVFKHADGEYATNIARQVKLPGNDRVNETYSINPTLIGLLQLDWTNELPDKEVYKNKGLHLAEEEAAKQDLEANAQKAVQENIRNMEFAEESVPPRSL